MRRNKSNHARRRGAGLTAALALAASVTLVLSACGGEAKEEPKTHGSAGPEQEAVNDGAGIPTKPLSVAKSKAAVLTEEEIPGGVEGYREQRLGAQRLAAGRSLSSLSGLNSQCSTALRATQKDRASVLSGAQVTATVPKEASGTDTAGKLTITVFTTRAGTKTGDALDTMADACSGTVAEPDSIAPVQRGLKGVAVTQGKTRLSVAAGDWGSNHLLVETTGVDADVAQQFADAQLAKLAAPQD